MLKEKVIKLNDVKNYKKYRDQDIALLLKLIVIDGMTDLKEIETKVIPAQATFERYLGSKDIMMQYLSEEEYNEYLTYYNKLTNFIKDEKVNKKNKRMVDDNITLDNLVSDIMESRLSKNQILINNYITQDKYRELLYNEKLVEERFGKGFYEKLHNRIKENSIVRERVPANRILVEEKNDVKILKEGLIHLSELEFNRLRVISDYMSSECDINLTAKKNNISVISVVNVLNHPKNNEILKPQVDIFVKDMGKFEKTLLEGNFEERKVIVDNIINRLKANNYDINKTTQELLLPYNLVSRYLSQGFVSIYYPTEQINQIFEEENKKGLK